MLPTITLPESACTTRTPTLRMRATVALRHTPHPVVLDGFDQFLCQNGLLRFVWKNPEGEITSRRLDYHTREVLYPLDQIASNTVDLAYDADPRIPGYGRNRTTTQAHVRLRGNPEPLQFDGLYGVEFDGLHRVGHRDGMATFVWRDSFQRLVRSLSYPMDTIAHIDTRTTPFDTPAAT